MTTVITPTPVPAPAPAPAPVTSKPWYTSKTLWGIVIALGGYFLAKLGIPVTPAPNADFATIQAYIAQIEAAKGNFGQIAGIALSAIGTIVAIYGRIVADTKLTFFKK